MEIDDAIDHFNTLARAFYENAEATEADFWKLQSAARDAVISINIFHGGVVIPALLDMLSIAQALLGGSAASIIVRVEGRWSVEAATGENTDSLVGASINQKDDSISAKVINSGKPFYFSKIDHDTERKSGNKKKRYSTNYFCSFPILDDNGEVVGVLNVAGMDGAHPLFESEQSTLDGFIGAIALKLIAMTSRKQKK